MFFWNMSKSLLLEKVQYIIMLIIKTHDGSTKIRRSGGGKVCGRI
jgi:hypothetical protein